MPLNFLEAMNGIKTFNVLSAEGLNVYSMLKHKTLVLTLDTVNLLEQRLLHYMHSYNKTKLNKNLQIMESQLGLDSYQQKEKLLRFQETEI
nr:39S ribosomal protein L4, mitochondrial-like [Lytechinus pictus]